MSYTRRPQQVRECTFTVSWIEEPVTVPTIGSVPFPALAKAQEHGRVTELFNALPDELSILFETASGDEMREFAKRWSDASDRADWEADHTVSIFEKLIRGLT